MSPTRVLVTGGAGFFGMHLARELIGAGDSVRVRDVAAAPRWVTELGLAYRRGDLRDRALLDDALQGVDALVHAAFAPPQRPPVEVHAVNVEGTRTLLERCAARRVPRAVIISSTIVSRAPRIHPLWRGAPLSRLDAYRASRVAAERVAEECSPDVSVCVVRPKTFLGPERVGAFAIVFERIRRGLAVPVLGAGTNRYQLLDVRDGADAVRRLAHHTGGGCYELGARHYASIAEDLQALIDHARTGARLHFMSPSLARVLLRGLELAGLPPLSEWHQVTARGGDSAVDTSRAERELGWQARRSNRQSLCDAYDWYRDRVASQGSAETTHPVPVAHRMLQRLLAFWP